MGVDIAYQGLLVSALVLVSYFIGAWMDDGDHGMTMAFLTMSMAEIFHSLNMRSQRGSIFKLKGQNVLLLGAAAAALVLTTLVCEVNFLANAFGFTHVNLTEYAIAVGLGVLMIPVVEIVKFIQRKLAKQ